MTATNTSIATTEVLVSPNGDMIAVAPLTNAKGSLISAYATPSLNLALFCLCHHGGVQRGKPGNSFRLELATS